MPPMRLQVAFALAAVVALVAGAVSVYAAPDPTQLDRYDPIIVPSKICRIGGPPASLPAGAIFSTDFDGSVPPYQLSVSSTNYWHVTSFPGQGTDGGHSAPGRLYFGVERPQGGSFNFGTTRGAITFLQPITIPLAGETVISWNEKWEVEWGGFGLYDVMALTLPSSPSAPLVSGFPIPSSILCISDPLDPVTQAEDPGTGIPACSPLLHQPCGQPPGWMTRFDLVPDSYKGKTVYLRFSFDAIDSLYNDFLGWMIDDVNVFTVGV